MTITNGLDVELSIADKAVLNQRASIKHYPRIFKRLGHGGKINGRLTFTYMRLNLKKYAKDANGTNINVTAVCLELGIDELGIGKN